MLMHLRRIGPRKSRPESSDFICFKGTITIVGRSLTQVDYVLCSADHIRNTIISRIHARIVRNSAGQHLLHDDSLNGIFVNGIKISDSRVLCEGDTVTFGHPNGASLECDGRRVRQPDSEFQFIFECCRCQEVNQNKVAADTSAPSQKSHKTEDADGFVMPIDTAPRGRTLSRATCRLRDQTISLPLVDESSRTPRAALSQHSSQHSTREREASLDTYPASDAHDTCADRPSHQDSSQVESSIREENVVTEHDALIHQTPGNHTHRSYDPADAILAQKSNEETVTERNSGRENITILSKPTQSLASGSLISNKQIDTCDIPEIVGFTKPRPEGVSATMSMHNMSEKASENAKQATSQFPCESVKEVMKDEVAKSVKATSLQLVEIPLQSEESIDVKMSLQMTQSQTMATPEPDAKDKNRKDEDQKTFEVEPQYFPELEPMETFEQTTPSEPMKTIEQTKVTEVLEVRDIVVSPRKVPDSITEETKLEESPVKLVPKVKDIHTKDESCEPIDMSVHSAISESMKAFGTHEMAQSVEITPQPEETIAVTSVPDEIQLTSENAVQATRSRLMESDNVTEIEAVEISEEATSLKMTQIPLQTEESTVVKVCLQMAPSERTATSDSIAQIRIHETASISESTIAVEQPPPITVSRQLETSERKTTSEPIHVIEETKTKPTEFFETPANVTVPGTVKTLVNIFDTIAEDTKTAETSVDMTVPEAEKKPMENESYETMEMPMDLTTSEPMKAFAQNEAPSQNLIKENKQTSAEKVSEEITASESLLHSTVQTQIRCIDTTELPKEIACEHLKSLEEASSETLTTNATAINPVEIRVHNSQIDISRSEETSAEMVASETMGKPKDARGTVPKSLQIICTDVVSQSSVSVTANTMDVPIDVHVTVPEYERTCTLVDAQPTVPDSSKTIDTAVDATVINSVKTMDICADADATVSDSAETTGTSKNVHASNPAPDETLGTSVDSHVTVPASDKTLGASVETHAAVPASDKTLGASVDTNATVPASDKTLGASVETHAAVPASDKTLGASVETHAADPASDNTLGASVETHAAVPASDKTLGASVETHAAVPASDKTLGASVETHAAVPASDKTLGASVDTNATVPASEKTVNISADAHAGIPDTDKTVGTQVDAHDTVPNSAQSVNTSVNANATVPDSAETMDISSDVHATAPYSEKTSISADCYSTVPESSKTVDMSVDSHSTVSDSAEITSTLVHTTVLNNVKSIDTYLDSPTMTNGTTKVPMEVTNLEIAGAPLEIETCELSQTPEVLNVSLKKVHEGNLQLDTETDETSVDHATTKIKKHPGQSQSPMVRDTVVSVDVRQSQESISQITGPVNISDENTDNLKQTPSEFILNKAVEQDKENSVESESIKQGKSNKIGEVIVLDFKEMPDETVGRDRSRGEDIASQERSLENQNMPSQAGKPSQVEPTTQVEMSDGGKTQLKEVLETAAETSFKEAHHFINTSAHARDAEPAKEPIKHRHEELKHVAHIEQNPVDISETTDIQLNIYKIEKAESENIEAHVPDVDDETHDDIISLPSLDKQLIEDEADNVARVDMDKPQKEEKSIKIQSSDDYETAEEDVTLHEERDVADSDFLCQSSDQTTRCEDTLETLCDSELDNNTDDSVHDEDDASEDDLSMRTQTDRPKTSSVTSDGTIVLMSEVELSQDETEIENVPTSSDELLKCGSSEELCGMNSTEAVFENLEIGMNTQWPVRSNVLQLENATPDDRESETYELGKESKALGNTDISDQGMEMEDESDVLEPTTDAIPDKTEVYEQEKDTGMSESDQFSEDIENTRKEQCTTRICDEENEKIDLGKADMCDQERDEQGMHAILNQENLIEHPDQTDNPEQEQKIQEPDKSDAHEQEQEIEEESKVNVSEQVNEIKEKRLIMDTDAAEISDGKKTEEPTKANTNEQVKKIEMQSIGNEEILQHEKRVKEMDVTEIPDDDKEGDEPVKAETHEQEKEIAEQGIRQNENFAQETHGEGSSEDEITKPDLEINERGMDEIPEQDSTADIVDQEDIEESVDYIRETQKDIEKQEMLEIREDAIVLLSQNELSQKVTEIENTSLSLNATQDIPKLNTNDAESGISERVDHAMNSQGLEKAVNRDNETYLVDQNEADICEEEKEIKEQRNTDICLQKSDIENVSKSDVHVQETVYEQLGHIEIYEQDIEIENIEELGTAQICARETDRELDQAEISEKDTNFKDGKADVIDQEHVNFEELDLADMAEDEKEIGKPSKTAVQEKEIEVQGKDKNPEQENEIQGMDMMSNDEETEEPVETTTHYEEMEIKKQNEMLEQENEVEEHGENDVCEKEQEIAEQNNAEILEQDQENDIQDINSSEEAIKTGIRKQEQDKTDEEVLEQEERSLELTKAKFLKQVDYLQDSEKIEICTPDIDIHESVICTPDIEIRESVKTVINEQQTLSQESGMIVFSESQTESPDHEKLEISEYESETISAEKNEQEIQSRACRAVETNVPEKKSPKALKIIEQEHIQISVQENEISELTVVSEKERFNDQPGKTGIYGRNQEIETSEMGEIEEGDNIKQLVMEKICVVENEFEELENAKLPEQEKANDESRVVIPDQEDQTKVPDTTDVAGPFKELEEPCQAVIHQHQKEIDEQDEDENPEKRDIKTSGNIELLEGEDEVLDKEKESEEPGKPDFQEQDKEIEEHYKGEITEEKAKDIKVNDTFETSDDENETEEDEGKDDTIGQVNESNGSYQAETHENETEIEEQGKEEIQKENDSEDGDEVEMSDGENEIEKQTQDKDEILGEEKQSEELGKAEIREQEKELNERCNNEITEEAKNIKETVNVEISEGENETGEQVKDKDEILGQDNESDEPYTAEFHDQENEIEERDKDDIQNENDIKGADKGDMSDEENETEESMKSNDAIFGQEKESDEPSKAEIHEQEKEIKEQGKSETMGETTATVSIDEEKQGEVCSRIGTDESGTSQKVKEMEQGHTIEESEKSECVELAKESQNPTETEALEHSQEIQDTNNSQIEEKEKPNLDQSQVIDQEKEIDGLYINEPCKRENDRQMHPLVNEEVIETTTMTQIQDENKGIQKCDQPTSQDVEKRDQVPNIDFTRKTDKMHVQEMSVHETEKENQMPEKNHGQGEKKEMENRIESMILSNRNSPKIASKIVKPVKIPKESLQHAVAVNVGCTLISLENRPKTPILKLRDVKEVTNRKALSVKRTALELPGLPMKRQKNVESSDKPNPLASKPPLVGAFRPRGASPRFIGSRSIIGSRTFPKPPSPKPSAKECDLTEEGQFSDAESECSFSSESLPTENIATPGQVSARKQLSDRKESPKTKLSRNTCSPPADVKKRKRSDSDSEDPNKLRRVQSTERKSPMQQRSADSNSTHEGSGKSSQGPNDNAIEDNSLSDQMSDIQESQSDGLSLYLEPSQPEGISDKYSLSQQKDVYCKLTVPHTAPDANGSASNNLLDSVATESSSVTDTQADMFDDENQCGSPNYKDSDTPHGNGSTKDTADLSIKSVVSIELDRTDSNQYKTSPMSGSNALAPGEDALKGKEGCSTVQTDAEEIVSASCSQDGHTSDDDGPLKINKLMHSPVYAQNVLSETSHDESEFDMDKIGKGVESAVEKVISLDKDADNSSSDTSVEIPKFKTNRLNRSLRTESQSSESSVQPSDDDENKTTDSGRVSPSAIRCESSTIDKAQLNELNNVNTGTEEMEKNAELPAVPVFEERRDVLDAMVLSCETLVFEKSVTSDRTDISDTPEQTEADNHTFQISVQPSSVYNNLDEGESTLSTVDQPTAVSSNCQQITFSETTMASTLERETMKPTAHIEQVGANIATAKQTVTSALMENSEDVYDQLATSPVRKEDIMTAVENVQQITTNDVSAPEIEETFDTEEMSAHSEASNTEQMTGLLEQDDQNANGPTTTKDKLAEPPQELDIQAEVSSEAFERHHHSNDEQMSSREVQQERGIMAEKIESQTIIDNGEAADLKRNNDTIEKQPTESILSETARFPISDMPCDKESEIEYSERQSSADSKYETALEEFASDSTAKSVVEKPQVAFTVSHDTFEEGDKAFETSNSEEDLEKTAFEAQGTPDQLVDDDVGKTTTYSENPTCIPCKPNTQLLQSPVFNPIDSNLSDSFEELDECVHDAEESILANERTLPRSESPEFYSIVCEQVPEDNQSFDDGGRIVQRSESPEFDLIVSNDSEHEHELGDIHDTDLSNEEIDQESNESPLHFENDSNCLSLDKSLTNDSDVTQSAKRDRPSSWELEVNEIEMSQEIPVCNAVTKRQRTMSEDMSQELPVCNVVTSSQTSAETSPEIPICNLSEKEIQNSEPSPILSTLTTLSTSADNTTGGNDHVSHAVDSISTIVNCSFENDADLEFEAPVVSLEALESQSAESGTENDTVNNETVPDAPNNLKPQPSGTVSNSILADNISSDRNVDLNDVILNATEEPFETMATQRYPSDADKENAPHDRADVDIQRYPSDIEDHSAEDNMEADQSEHGIDEQEENAFNVKGGAPSKTASEANTLRSTVQPLGISRDEDDRSPHIHSQQITKMYSSEIANFSEWSSFAKADKQQNPDDIEQSVESTSPREVSIANIDSSSSDNCSENVDVAYTGVQRKDQGISKCTVAMSSSKPMESTAESELDLNQCIMGKPDEITEGIDTARQSSIDNIGSNLSSNIMLERINIVPITDTDARVEKIAEHTDDSNVVSDSQCDDSQETAMTPTRGKSEMYSGYSETTGNNNLIQGYASSGSDVICTHVEISSQAINNDGSNKDMLNVFGDIYSTSESDEPAVSCDKRQEAIDQDGISDTTNADAQVSELTNEAQGMKEICNEEEAKPTRKRPFKIDMNSLVPSGESSSMNKPCVLPAKKRKEKPTNLMDSEEFSDKAYGEAELPDLLKSRKVTDDDSERLSISETSKNSTRDIKKERSNVGGTLARINQRRSLKLEKQEPETPPHSPVDHDRFDLPSSQESVCSRHALEEAQREVCLRSIAGNLSLENADELLSRASNAMQGLETVFVEKGRIEIGNKTRVDSWQQHLNKMLQEEKSVPQTVIAVVGDTGAGKSSLMNAVLDHADVLPTSGIRACTAVVVQIANNANSDIEYVAEIEFLAEEEWESELRMLMTELRTADGRIKTRQPDPRTEEGVAWSKIRAVYGPYPEHVTLEQLKQDRRVTHWLGKTKRVSETSPSEFAAAVNKYIENTELFKGGEIWPIVKHVKLALPRCPVLQSGAILVDLPGIRDSNAARDKIARNFLQNCTAVWVVAEIHRAVSSETAKNLLGQHFRRQLLMDGHYGSVTFVCTKTDSSLLASEITRQLPDAREQVRPLQREIDALELQMRESTHNVSDIKRRLRHNSRSQRNLEKELTDLQGEVNELDAALEDGEGDCNVEVLEALAVVKEELSTKTAQLSDEEREHNVLAKNQIQLESQVSSLEGKLKKLRRDLNVLCARARNEYACKQIKRDFKAGLKEMKRLAGMDVNDMDDVMDIDDDIEDDVSTTTENLRVFCVSSTDYLKLKGKVHDTPAVFRKIRDTGLPALQRFVHELTRVRKVQGTAKIIRKWAHFISEILNYLIDEGTQDKTIRSEVKREFAKGIQGLKDEKKESIIEKVNTDLDKLITSYLKPKVDEGNVMACTKAKEVYTKWASKPNPDKPEKGGLYWATYKAVVQRQGVYRSPKMGPIDFNADLAAPMYTSIMIEWDRLFNHKLASILDVYRRDVLVAAKQLAWTLRERFLALGVSRDRVDRAYVQHLNTLNVNVMQAVETLKEHITDRQRDVNRALPPAVQENMLAAYSACSEEHGQGCFKRIKDRMAGYIEEHKHIMFDEASLKLLQGLLALQREMTAGLRNVFDSMCRELMALYEPLWENPMQSRNLRTLYMHDVGEIYQKMEAVLKDAGLEMELKHTQDVAEEDSSAIFTQQSRVIAETVTADKRKLLENLNTGEAKSMSVTNTLSLPPSTNTLENTDCVTECHVLERSTDGQVTLPKALEKSKKKPVIVVKGENGMKQAKTTVTGIDLLSSIKRSVTAVSVPPKFDIRTKLTPVKARVAMAKHVVPEQNRTVTEELVSKPKQSAEVSKETQPDNAKTGITENKSTKKLTKKSKLKKQAKKYAGDKVCDVCKSSRFIGNHCTVCGSVAEVSDHSYAAERQGATSANLNQSSSISKQSIPDGAQVTKNTAVPPLPQRVNVSSKPQPTTSRVTSERGMDLVARVTTATPSNAGFTVVPSKAQPTTNVATVSAISGGVANTEATKGVPTLVSSSQATSTAKNTIFTSSGKVISMNPDTRLSKIKFTKPLMTKHTVTTSQPQSTSDGSPKGRTPKSKANQKTFPSRILDDRTNQASGSLLTKGKKTTAARMLSLTSSPSNHKMAARNTSTKKDAPSKRKRPMNYGMVDLTLSDDGESEEPSSKRLYQEH